MKSIANAETPIQNAIASSHTISATGLPSLYQRPKATPAPEPITLPFEGRVSLAPSPEERDVIPGAAHLRAAGRESRRSVQSDTRGGAISSCCRDRQACSGIL